MYRTKSRRNKRTRLLIRLYITVLSLILLIAMMGLLAQTAFAKTYVITDGDRVVTGTGWSPTPPSPPTRTKFWARPGFP